jgi:copper chaperone NosL
VRSSAALLLLAAFTACDGEPAPEDLVKGRDVCASCRMPVSDPRFAAQITAPGELPQFFDEAGCLADFVKAGSSKASGAVAWVADHRTRAWVRADRAVFTRVPNLQTPMSHHLIAHESAASRDSDPDARDGQPVAFRELFGPSGPPSGA